MIISDDRIKQWHPFLYRYMGVVEKAYVPRSGEGGSNQGNDTTGNGGSDNQGGNQGGGLGQN
jgi:hypothetical protein